MKKILCFALVCVMFLSCMTVAFAEEDISVVLGGEKIDFEDAKPRIINDRTMVPLRAIFEALGAEVSWDDNAKTVTAVKGDVAIKMAIGADSFTRNEETVALDSPATIVDSRTLVPVRVIAESFGSKVKWIAETKTVEISEKKTVYNILSFGNSYTNDSFSYLTKIAAKDGVQIHAVNMYKGSCGLDQHYAFMKGEGTYAKMYEYLPDGTKQNTAEPTFDDGLLLEGIKWDYITLHQRGRHSCFFDTFYTEEKPYITELASYIKEKAPQSELLFFEHWGPYTDRIEEMYEDYNYKAIVEGHRKNEYYPLLFNEIKNTYLKAAEMIGNPGRVIPAGEAIYLAVTKYGFDEYVLNSEGTGFESGARAMYRDSSSHLASPYGQVLAGLTWYEYLTGNDVRKNPYTHSKIPEEDMALLKEIAHEACMQPEYVK